MKKNVEVTSSKPKEFLIKAACKKYEWARGSADRLFATAVLIFMAKGGTVSGWFPKYGYAAHPEHEFTGTVIDWSGTFVIPSSVWAILLGEVVLDDSDHAIQVQEDSRTYGAARLSRAGLSYLASVLEEQIFRDVYPFSVEVEESDEGEGG